MKKLVALLAAALVAGACSVSTPRHEALAFRRTGPAAIDGEPQSTVEGAALGADPFPETAGAAATTIGDGSPTTQATDTATPATAPPVDKAASATAVPGVTKTTVTVSVVAGFSGPLAAMVQRAYDGLLTWQDDVNAANGINGRKVVLKKVDHKETADGGVAACKEVQSNNSYFAIVPEGVDATITAVSCLDAAGIPTFYYSATTNPKWKLAFADIVTSEQAGAEMASYVAHPLGAAKKKIGVIYVNQASYAALNNGFTPKAKQLGLDLASAEAVEANSASFTAPLLRLKQAGVQVLIISATTDAVGILRDAKSIGFNAQFVGWGFQFDFITTAGRDLFQGVAALRAYATVDSAAYNAYAARMQARGRGRNRTDDLEGFSAYGHALVTGELIKRAGPNPTRASLVAGAETFRAFDNGVVGPLTWSPTDHVGTHTTFPTVCCNSDWTWKTAGAPRTEY